MSTRSVQRPQDYRRRHDALAGWAVGVVSYRLGEHFLCEVDNVSPGARIARGEGATREEAEAKALDKARERLSRTRIVDVG
ncbi:hypothetical protein QNA08_01850 [Chelatococcus sp. SYSU_G07232]|uniref:DRBM domain-containing protein n=1 Tax=Chelatococcus albus TaxID=3047466 RepID=A0ABT7ADV3_9HYPH|nr:hypothetical protein [Chelatococcus sp. SYSU_G07232]MDJ1156984.1 hypothetical protein [Chelatococcus sp. SYSU_G07232]